MTLRGNGFLEKRLLRVGSVDSAHTPLAHSTMSMHSRPPLTLNDVAGADIIHRIMQSLIATAAVYDPTYHILGEAVPKTDPRPGFLWVRALCCTCWAMRQAYYALIQSRGICEAMRNCIKTGPVGVDVVSAALHPSTTPAFMHDLIGRFGSNV